MSRPSPPIAPARRPSNAPRTGADTPATFLADRRFDEPAEHGPADFPGCEPFHLPASELEGYEGRASNSGRHVPRPPGGSASPPPSTTSARPGASAGSRSASSRCAGRGSRASARRTSPGSTRRATSSRSSRPTRRCTCTRRRSRVPGPAINVDDDPAAGRRAGGGPHHGRAKAQARNLRGVGLSGGLGARAARSPGLRTARDSTSTSSRTAAIGRHRRAKRSPGMAGGRDLPRPHRGSAVTESEAGPGAGWRGRWAPAKAPGPEDDPIHPLPECDGKG